MNKCFPFFWQSFISETQMRYYSLRDMATLRPKWDNIVIREEPPWEYIANEFSFG